MVKVTLKGILAHKIRFVLTGVAVILGVVVHLRDARPHRDDQQDVRRALREHLREHRRGRAREGAVRRRRSVPGEVGSTIR